jgi:hypothetical protein
MAALCDEVCTPGAAATDTRASTAIALTRASFDVVARSSAAIDVTRLSAMSGHDFRPHLIPCSPEARPRPSHKEHGVLRCGSSWATMARPIAMMVATTPSMRSVLLSLAG